MTTQALLLHPFHTATFDGVNPPAWTLAVEAQLYLAYPVVFWLSARLGPLRALGAVLAVTMAYRVALALVPLPVELAGPAWVVFLARWFEWVLGATVAEWAAGRLTLPRVLRTPWPGIAVLGGGRVDRVAHRILRPLHREGAGLRTWRSPCSSTRRWLTSDRGSRRRRGGIWAGSASTPTASTCSTGPSSSPSSRSSARSRRGPCVIALGMPSSLLIMAATTPLVLWASRVFYRYCERPSIQRSQAA